MEKSKNSKGFFKRHARGFTISLSVVLLIVSTLSFWVTNNIYDSDRFATNLSDALLEPESRDILAKQINEKVLEDYPLVNKAIGGKTTDLIASLLGTPALNDAVYRLAYSANKLITSDSGQSIEINIAGIIEPLEAVARALDPEIEVKFESIPTQIVILDRSDVPNYQGIGQALLIIGPLSLLALLAVLVVSWKRSSENGYTFMSDVGTVLLLGSGAIFIVTYTSGALITLNIVDPNSSQLMQIVYNALVYNLRVYLAVLFVSGLLLKIYAAYRTNWWQHFSSRFSSRA